MSCTHCNYRFKFDDKKFALYELREDLTKVWRTDLCSKCDWDIDVRNEKIRNKVAELRGVDTSIAIRFFKDLGDYKEGL